MIKKSPLTFDLEVQLCPALMEVFSIATAYGQFCELVSPKMFCANTCWYEHIKPQLDKLVGFRAQDARLRTTVAYSIAYKSIYNQLPDCCNCNCLPKGYFI